MTSDITPVLGTHQTCPHSGLTITTKPAWQDIPVGSHYTMSYGIIGENILFSVPKGNLRTVHITQATQARDQVLLEHFGTPDPVITEIKDFSQAHGVPSHTTRTLFRQSVTSQKHQKGLFIINASWIIQAVFIAGIRLHKIPFPLNISATYGTALSGALDLLSNKMQTSTTKWLSQTPSVKVSHTIINHSIVFTRGDGKLVQEDIPTLLADYEKLLQSDELSPGPIYRIADYTQTTAGDWKGRLLLIQGLNKLHTRHKRTPVAMAVFGLKPALQSAMQLAGKLLKYPIYFAADETDAFAYVYKKQQGETITAATLPKNPEEVEDILRFISTIIWDDSEEISQPDLSQKPLAPISEALLVVKQDVRDLLLEAQKQTEEIAKKNKQLEAEIKRRTAIEARLTTAIDQAKAATKAKGEFLATMSHEIRTPMNGILGMLHLLENTPLNDEQRGYLQISGDSASSLLKLINDILDFSKVDQGQLQMEVTPFDLQELCRACCTLFNKDIQDKALNIHCILDPRIRQYVIGDPGKLRQILINLLSNAIKFTATGSITLQVDILKQTTELATIKFAVTDTGIGIDPEKTSSIFEAFSQADSSTTRQYGGTGLGLSISHKICSFMEGKLEVTSTPNRGSTFFFSLPFGLGQPIADKTAIPASQTPPTPPRKDIQILIVEDEPVNQFFVESLLDQFGYRHDHAANGREALKAVQNKLYQIVLMDCQMPEMDGYEATAKIRAIPFESTPPIIIALTAHAVEGERDRCLECGMDEYIAKPIVPSLLLETIEKYVAR